MASSLSPALSSLSLSPSPSSAPSTSLSSVLPKSSFFRPLPKCSHLFTRPVKSPNPFVLTTFAVLKPVSLIEETESPEEIRAGYEALYGLAFSGLQAKTSSGKMGEDEDGPAERGRRGRRSEEGDGFSRGAGGRDRGAKDSMEEKVVQIRRVTKVVKGGKQLSFRAIVIVGDKKGRVGVGVGKAKEVITAVQKSAADARRHIVTVPMTKYQTFPHRANGKYGAAKVMLRPATTGTGVIAGGSVRVVLELAGVINALGKELGSKNPLNNARAVIEAISTMKQFREVANDRGIPMEELWK